MLFRNYLSVGIAGEKKMVFVLLFSSKGVLFPRDRTVTKPVHDRTGDCLPQSAARVRIHEGFDARASGAHSQ
jgi:hypothetical protein